jgi:hypothetical protein
VLEKSDPGAFGSPGFLPQASVASALPLELVSEIREQPIQIAGAFK